MRPNFLCLGTFRAGTTWLFSVLKTHPEVFLPEEKELMFFTSHYGRGIRWYESFFGDYGGQKYAGDISPSYLSCEDAPRRIKKHLPAVKLLAILRNPADQIWSLYNLWIARGYTTKPLQRAIMEEDEFFNNVLYFKHLSNYLDFFDIDDILILFYDDLNADALRFLDAIYAFLGIESIIHDDFVRKKNQTRVPKSILLEKLTASSGDLLRRSGLLSIKTLLSKTGINNFIKGINTRQQTKTQMPSHIRALINDHIADDKKKLSNLVGRDLSSWN